MDTPKIHFVLLFL